MSKADELEEAGWSRQGPFWKAPGDGPTGRKWTVDQAFLEMTRRGSKSTPKRRKKKGDGDDKT